MADSEETYRKAAADNHAHAPRRIRPQELEIRVQEELVRGNRSNTDPKAWP